MIESEDDLKKIIISASQGNRDSFGILYEEYFSPIYRFIYFQVKHSQEAEDLAQVVFLKAFRGMESYKLTAAPFRAWLYQIARNTVKDFWKKKKDIILNEPDKVFPQIPDDSNLLEESLKKEDAEVLMKNISELSEDHRDIIIMHSIEGLAYVEISEIVGKNEEALRALKHRAIKVLRKKIQEDERF